MSELSPQAEASDMKFVPTCGCSSSGRAPPCQGGGSEFEPRHPLQFEEQMSVQLNNWALIHSSKKRQSTDQPTVLVLNLSRP